MQVHAGAADLTLLVEGRIRFVPGKNGKFHTRSERRKPANALSVFLAYGNEAVERLACAFLRGHIPGRIVRDLNPDEVFYDILGGKPDPAIFKAWPNFDPSVPSEPVWDAVE